MPGKCRGNRTTFRLLASFGPHRPMRAIVVPSGGPASWADNNRNAADPKTRRKHHDASQRRRSKVELFVAPDQRGPLRVQCLEAAQDTAFANDASRSLRL